MALPSRIAPLFPFGSQSAPVLRPSRPVPPALVEAPPPPQPPSPPSLPGAGGGGSIIVCPPGTQWDPYAEACVPVGQGPTLGGNFPSSGGTTATGGTGVTVTPEPSTVGEGPIYVNVANAVNVSDTSATNAIDSVAAAVRSGIQAGTNAASQSANAAIQAVQYGIDNLTTNLANGLDQAFGQTAGVITGVENGITSTLGSIGTTIGNDIFNAINPVSTGLGQIIQIIANQIGGLAGAIASAVGQLIPTIVGLITGAINPLTAVIQGISNEIHDSVAALTQLGTDVSGGFSGLDSTLGRLLSNWETYNSGFVEAQTGYPDGGDFHQDLSKIWQALAGLVSSLKGTAALNVADVLQTSCSGTDLDKWLHSDIDFGDLSDTWAASFWKCGAYLLRWVLVSIQAIPKVLEESRLIANQQCQLGRLEVDQLVQAVQRGFLDVPAAIKEAAQQDIDNTRFDVLQNLALHQMNPQELVEALFRGLITQDDYNLALKQQGWTPGQQNLLQGIGVNLLNLTELWELVRRGTIGPDVQDAGLKALHYDDAQRKALASLTFRPATMNEAIDGAAASDALAGTGASTLANLQAVPEFVQSAAASEGLSPDATAARWSSHWATGSIGLWLDAYFRGLSDFGGLQAVLRRAFIPDPLHHVVVDASRPLIQFRTISRMVFLKILTPEQGLAQLKKHGYSDADATTLIDYALVSGKAPAAQRAQAQHAVSIEIAKEEYIDGSISAAQFYDVLIAHNYTPEGANTEIAVIDAHQAMLARKAAAQLIVDEYGAGLINEQVALAQLAAQGLTVAELAKYAHKIRAFRTKNAKIPTESELLKMLKAGIITKDDYINALIAQGYSSKWSNAFYDLGFPANPPSTGPATPSPAPTSAPTAATGAPLAG